MHKESDSIPHGNTSTEVSGYVPDTEDCCKFCYEPFEAEEDMFGNMDVTIPIELGIGNFCSSHCASRYAFSQLSLAQKKDAQKFVAALNAILDFPKEFLALLDAEEDTKKLVAAACDMADHFALDEEPDWAE